MIYVERNIIPLPEVFYSKEVEIAKKRLEELQDLVRKAGLYSKFMADKLEVRQEVYRHY